MYYQITDDETERIFENEESEIDNYSYISKDNENIDQLIQNIFNPINEPKIQNNNAVIKEETEEKESTEKEESIEKKKTEKSDNVSEKENDENENSENIENGNTEINEKKVKFSIENEKMLKIGNKLKKKSYRCDNIVIMIIRNLIQEIFLDWINYGVSDNSKQLCKINPQIFRKKIDFKGKKIKDIYSKEISQKEKEKHSFSDYHNILIIESADGVKNIKLNFTFEEALKLFFYKNNATANIFDNINIDENKEEVILKGLKGKEEYINRKEGDSLFKTKLIKSLDKIKQEYNIFLN